MVFFNIIENWIQYDDHIVNIVSQEDIQNLDGGGTKKTKFVQFFF